MSQRGCVSIQINGQNLQVERGLTVLEAARQHEIEIPTLCDYPGLPPHGSCRLCVVEIEGRANTPTACTTPVEDGMSVRTHSPAVMALRKELLQLLLADHPSSCLYCPEKDRCDECMITLRKAGVTTGCGACPKDEQCALQALAEQYEIRQPAYPIRYRMLPAVHSDPFIDSDPNLCILCGRCIRACQEQRAANTLTYQGRGADAQVSTAFQRGRLAATCTFCGACVELCPTGALTEKTRKWDGKPERATASTCPLCSIGCQIDLLSKGERVMGSLPNRKAGTEGLCVNGRFGITELVDPAARLKTAQHAAGGARQPAALEDAVRLAAERLSSCRPERFALQISAGCSNEDLYVARQFSRQVMGSSPVLASAWRRYGGALDDIARRLPASVSLETALSGPVENAVILSIGLDDRYTQSVAGALIFRARKRGAAHIALSAGPSPVPDGCDLRLHAARGDLAAALDELAQKIAGLIRAKDGTFPKNGSVIDAAARMLAQAGTPVIILAAQALAHPQNAALLDTVQALTASLGARVSLLPAEGNLAGALHLGLLDAPADSHPDVLFLIGEAPPIPQPGGPFVIAHTLAEPDALVEGLLFPAAAFSEQHGTIIDYAGRVQAFHPAVPPPGDALPAWQLLSKIALQMGAPGFDYDCMEDIHRAAQAEFPGFPAHLPPEAGAALPLRRAPASGSGWQAPDYMGMALAQRVAGLRSLYPTDPRVSADE